MTDNNQEAYRDLEKIIDISESGFFLVIASEKIQAELGQSYIANKNNLGIYDYKGKGHTYSFGSINSWVHDHPEYSTVMILNLQTALQTEQDVERLNFSRDMLSGLNKNIIFMVTQSGDNKLVRNAYDFYSFIKLRIIITDDIGTETVGKNNLSDIQQCLNLPNPEEHLLKESYKKGMEPQKKKQLLAETISEMAKAEQFEKEQNYEMALNIYIRALKIRKEVLGEDHQDTANAYEHLAFIYGELQNYADAEKLYTMVLKIRRRVQGETHPDLALSYDNFGNLYRMERKYKEAEKLYLNALSIRRVIFGEKHPAIAQSFSNLAHVYEIEKRYAEAEEEYRKAINIYEETLGDSALELIELYNNLTAVCEMQGK